MSRRSLINLLLFALAALLGLLIWWQQPQPLPPLTGLQPEQIVTIRIRDASGRDIRLDKHVGRWRLGEADADAARIEQLLGICRTPSLRRFPIPPGNLEEFGLQDPAIRLWLNELELAFGHNDPVNGWRYVLVGQQIHLIGDGFHHHLSAPAAAFLREP